MKKFAIIMVLLILCSGCTAAPSEETVPTAAETTQAATQISEATDPPHILPSTTPTEPATQMPTESTVELPPATEAPEGTTIPTTAVTVPPASETLPITVPTNPSQPESTVLQYQNIKALWLSQFDLMDIYLDAGSQREETDFTQRITQILDNIVSQGFNTIFLQVRPNGDSMYPSQYYPMSAYVVGSLDRQAQYDPVALTVQLAHERNLSIHAWINPMRAMSEADIALVPQAFALRQWYDNPEHRGKYIVLVKGNWYLNPAYAPVRELISAGAQELLSSYAFDGLHMDDYFYPTTEESFDAEAYRNYLSDGGTLDLASFRRENLNLLVQNLYQITHSSHPERLFGISPAGNLDTVYNSQYADVYRWCSQDGFLDYICPQVYFGLEHGTHDFKTVSRRYQELIVSDQVDLLVGMTFGKAFTQEDPWAGKGKLEWKENQDVLARCLQTTLDLETCRGVAVFCYQYFFDPLTGESIPQTALERENFIPLFQEIQWE